MGLLSSLFGKEYVEKCIRNLFLALKEKYGKEAKEEGKFFNSLKVWDMMDIRDKCSTDGKGAFGNIHHAHTVRFWYEKEEAYGNTQGFYMEVTGTVRGEERTHRAMEADDEPGYIYVLLDD